jgi:hypothetical protein
MFTIQRNYFDLLSLRMFVVYKFIQGTLKGRTLKKVLFSEEKLNEGEYLKFEEKKIRLAMEIPESGFSISGLVMLEAGLDKLSIFVENNTFFVEDIYKVLFSDSYIKDGKIVG